MILLSHFFVYRQDILKKKKMSVAEFMETGGNKLKVHILQKINDENYIGGDETKILHIKVPNNKFGALASSQSYTVIKPEKQDNETLVLNPKFKPVKIAKLHLTDKTNIVEEILNRIKENVNVGKTSGETFETIASKPANAKLSQMIVKCISKSRIITSPYGEYRIAKVRDSDNNKGDINLNKHTKNKMEVGKLYQIENFKVSNYKGDNSEFRRLATLPMTLIKEVGKDNEERYRHIRLGDEEGSGDCLGIGRTFGYFGCANCWKKVELENSFCTKCSAPTTDITMEFSTELYLEIEDEVHTFQKTLP